MIRDRAARGFNDIALAGQLCRLCEHTGLTVAVVCQEPPKFISFADDINRHMPRYVVELVADALNGRERSVRGARVLVVGVAYKPNVADTRDSPAFEIVETLQRKGAAVAYHDPHVPTFTVGGATLQSVDLGQADLAAWDVILILTGHDGCDWKRMAREGALVIDTRNVTEGIHHSGNIIRL